ncbi:hypothetical protein RIF29_13555 [Crotalaria pallida]|uniref:Uncharacterized protein n=1 Tax=Crotalaria pallida TaxID=3830 RepID=A0AAN9IPQ7_CROPI
MDTTPTVKSLDEHFQADIFGLICKEISHLATFTMHLIYTVDGASGCRGESGNDRENNGGGKVAGGDSVP